MIDASHVTTQHNIITVRTSTHLVTARRSFRHRTRVQSHVSLHHPLIVRLSTCSSGKSSAANFLHLIHPFNVFVSHILKYLIDALSFEAVLIFGKLTTILINGRFSIFRFLDAALLHPPHTPVQCYFEWLKLYIGAITYSP